MNWTLGSLLQWTEAYFKKQGLRKPRFDAEFLLSHSLQKRRIDLYLEFDRPVIEKELSAFKELVKRRVQHEPIQYMTGRQHFWSFDFSVKPGIFIPRPETECLVEQSLQFLGARTQESIRILDIGCGSGVVAVVLAKECPQVAMVAVDISQAALFCATDNAKKLGVDSRIEFKWSNIYSNIEQGPFDLIVSNPPYIREEEWETLDREIRDYEPREALVGGERGIDFHLKIISEAPRFLKKGGGVLLEIAPDQTGILSEYAKNRNVFSSIDVVKDYSRSERVMVMKVE